MDKVSPVATRPTPVGGDVWCLAIGFSARALAEALRDAGLRVIAVDAFGDKDLQESSKVPQILSEWGALGVEKTLQTDRWTFYRELPNNCVTDSRLPVFLAGGCENWPDLLEFLASQPSLKLLGPSPQNIRTLRDPLVWQKACIGCDVVFPDSRSWTGHGSVTSVFHREGLPCQSGVSPSAHENAVTPPSQEGAVAHEDALTPPELQKRWLWKKRWTGGGLGVLRAESTEPPEVNDGQYLQEFVEGRSLGASFLIQSLENSPIDVQLVGVTESWNFTDWPGGSEFIYRGSFGPIELKPSQELAAKTLVLSLLQQSSPAGTIADDPTEPYRRWNGWLQIDFIESLDGQLWLLEVNPRWTAGMEVLRLSGLANMAAVHAIVNGVYLPETSAPLEAENSSQHQASNQPLFTFSCEPPSRWVGKAIYYAPSAIQLDEQKLIGLHQLLGQGFSDIPSDAMLGGWIETGHPVLTISATIDRKEVGKVERDESTARHEILQQLHAKRQSVDRLLGISC